MNFNSNWHSIETKLPDKTGDYLVCFCGESGFYAVMQFRDNKWWQGTHGEGKEWNPSGFLTHWRKIPSLFNYE